MLLDMWFTFFRISLLFSLTTQMPDQVTFKVLQWTMQVSGKFKMLTCEWTLWASIAQCHKAKKTEWKTNYMKYYHSKKTRATFSLALYPYIVAKSLAWWSEKCHVMIFCLSMKAEKGNIGRYYFFPGNFSSLWAILFSLPLKQSSLCVLQLKRKLTETMNMSRRVQRKSFLQLAIRASCWS